MRIVRAMKMVWEVLCFAVMVYCVVQMTVITPIMLHYMTKPHGQPQRIEEPGQQYEQPHVELA